MGTKANNARRAFGKPVDDWLWAWWDEKIVLQDARRSAAIELQYADDNRWYWRVNSGPRIQATNFFTAVDDALKQHKLPWPVHEDLRMIAAVEYERLRSMDEDYEKLIVRG